MQVSRFSVAEANVEVKQVTSKEKIATLEKVSKLWEEVAERKVKYYQKKYGKAHESLKTRVATDTYNMALAVQVGLKDKECTYFAAYDKKTKRVHGIAIVNLDGKQSHGESGPVLDDLLVNPENIQLIGKKPRRGIGTAMVKKVAQYILKKNENSLFLFSNQSAMEFYKKLGFTIIGQANADAHYEMYMGSKKLKNLASS